MRIAAVCSRKSNFDPLYPVLIKSNISLSPEMSTRVNEEDLSKLTPFPTEDRLLSQA